MNNWNNTQGATPERRAQIRYLQRIENLFNELGLMPDPEDWEILCDIAYGMDPNNPPDDFYLDYTGNDIYFYVLGVCIRLHPNLWAPAPSA